MLDAEPAELRFPGGRAEVADDEPEDERVEAMSGSVASGRLSEMLDEEKYNEKALLPPIDALEADVFFVNKSLSLLQYPKKSLMTLSSLSSLISAGTSSWKNALIRAENSLCRWSIVLWLGLNNVPFFDNLGR